MKKALIFDLDGTILDSMSIWTNIGEDYLKAKGVRDIPSDIKATLKPMSTLEAAGYFVQEFGIAKTQREVYDEIVEMLRRKYAEEVPIKSGVLEFLYKHKHCRMCIATATDKRLAELALQRLDILSYFRFIITSAEVGNSKRDPDIFIAAAKRLGAPIESCIVFEDALHAIKSAKSAGFYTVGVYEECFVQDSEEIEETADSFVHDLSEVSI